jgi:hypothetical protein
LGVTNPIRQKPQSVPKRARNSSREQPYLLGSQFLRWKEISRQPNSPLSTNPSQKSCFRPDRSQKGPKGSLMWPKQGGSSKSPEILVRLLMIRPPNRLQPPLQTLQ